MKKIAGRTYAPAFLSAHDALVRESICTLIYRLAYVSARGRGLIAACEHARPMEVLPFVFLPLFSLRFPLLPFLP